MAKIGQENFKVSIKKPDTKTDTLSVTDTTGKKTYNDLPIDHNVFISRIGFLLSIKDKKNDNIVYDYIIPEIYISHKIMNLFAEKKGAEELFYNILRNEINIFLPNHDWELALFSISDISFDIKCEPQDSDAISMIASALTKFFDQWEDN